jgi:hypothetical protein
MKIKELAEVAKQTHNGSFTSQCHSKLLKTALTLNTKKGAPSLEITV